MILFSLIVPTRARPAEFRRLLESLRETTRDLSSIEVIAVVDQDDPDSRDLSSGVRITVRCKHTQGVGKV